MTDTFDAVLAEMLETADVRDLRDGAVHTELVREWRDRLAAAHAAEVAERDARIAEAQETNRRLNRRVQMAEAAIPSYQKLIAIPPDGDGVRLANGSMGRALLTWYCEQLTERAEAAERDARRYRWLKENDSAFLLAEDVLDDQIAIATTEQADD